MMTRKVAIRTKGQSGPSGVDSQGLRRILGSNQFGASITNLCE